MIGRMDACEYPDVEAGRRSFQDMSGRMLNNGPFQ